MDIKELKNIITNKVDFKGPLIFKYEDNLFLCEQYVDAIAKNRGITKFYLASVNNLDYLDDSYLYIYKTDELRELDTYPENLIILCKKVAKDVSVDYIEFPKLQKWQIEDFVKVRVPGLDTEQCNWLCSICKYDIYRINQECAKLSLFNAKAQPIIFKQMNDEKAFEDLNILTIMSLVNAIMQRDYFTIECILSNLKNIDIEGTGLCTLLLRQFRSNIEVLFNKEWNDSMTCSEKQFKYLKWKPNTLYTGTQLINIYEFLVNLDIKLKSGELQFKAANRANNASYVDYIVLRVLTM